MKKFLLRFSIALLISTVLHAPNWIFIPYSLLAAPLSSLFVLLPWMGLQLVLIFVLPHKTYRAWEGFCFRVSYRVQERLGIYLPLYLIGLVACVIFANVWPKIFGSLATVSGRLWFHEIPPHFIVNLLK